MRCWVCRLQGREEDLVDEDLHRSCLFCGQTFCVPHHSANPWEIPSGVERTFYRVSWRDWSGVIREEHVKASNLCVVCGLSPQRDYPMPANVFVEFQKRVVQRDFQEKEQNGWVLL